jgi:alpha-tubulin suppressor-like RCC1 family protein
MCRAIADSVRRVLFCCGNGESGRLGLGHFESTNVFTAILSLLDQDINSVSCGFAHTTAVATDGSVYVFGDNTRGQLGHSGGLTEVPVPAEVLLPDSCTSVASGSAFTLALTTSGQVWGAQRVLAARLEHDVRATFIADSARMVSVALEQWHSISACSRAPCCARCKLQKACFTFYCMF